MPEADARIDRWRGCFADPAMERRYRDSAVGGQRKRALVIALVVILFPSLNLAHEVPHFLAGQSTMSLIFAARLASVAMSLLVLAFLARARSPALVENVLAAYGLYLAGVTFVVMAYHPGEDTILPASAVGSAAFVYFFAPLQLPHVVLLGAAISVAGWIACVDFHPLSPETAFRLALWLLSVNAVGYVGTNILHRTLRELFWDRRLLAERKAELEAAYDRERAAFQQFKQFAEMISHEFRNPLAVVKSKAQLLQLISDLGAPPDHDALPAIERAVNRLDNLFCRWLAQGQLADGDIVIEPRLTAIAELFRQTEAETPASSHHPVHFDAGPDGLKIMADPALIRGVISNLIDNAVKYSPQGGPIAVAARRQGDEIVLSVTDHGVGIAANQVAQVFDKYFRVSPDGPVKGLGLGLYLVQRIVDKHGGRVELQSKLGEGTTVSVCLPANPGLPGASFPRVDGKG
jgi:signal transduction histidine kinase